MGFQRLKGIGAVGKMDGSGRHVAGFKIKHISGQHLRKVAFDTWSSRLVRGGVAVLTTVGASRINIDAVTVTAWKVLLAGKRAIPLQYARPRGAKDRLLGLTRQEVARQRLLIANRLILPDWPKASVDTTDEFGERSRVSLRWLFQVIERPLAADPEVLVEDSPRALTLL